jgi:hypothetical protein
MVTQQAVLTCTAMNKRGGIDDTDDTDDDSMVVVTAPY